MYYYVLGAEGINREDCVKLVEESGMTWFIPSDPANYHWVEYQAWLAADPENNIPQEEV